MGTQRPLIKCNKTLEIQKIRQSGRRGKKVKYDIDFHVQTFSFHYLQSITITIKSMESPM